MAASPFTSISKASPNGEKPIIVCTTTILSSFAEQIGGDYVTVESIVPPGVCPAHYDITPSAVYAVSNASLVIYTGIEPWLESLIEASGNTNVTRLQVGGPWHPYTAALTYVRRIRDALKEVMPERSSYFEEHARIVEETINATASEIATNATALEVDKVKVVCMQWQKAFVEWLGFDVVATYRPPERMTTSEILELTSIAEREGVVLVIDNLPSGYTFGAKLAADIGAQHVVLTNFPGAVPGTETYAKMIEYNARQLFEAVKRYRLIQSEIKDLTDALNNANTQIRLLSATTIIFIATTVVEALIIYRRRGR
ncbi:MAG: periplasmic solute binding protein [Candidatus Bathyarchaeota archaeon B26-2]|nr:MAG: periplasmic solute binding protein [Candidatus Bathyarchaeota archaeon B26-2]